MAKSTIKRKVLEDKCKWESGELGTSIEHAEPATPEHEKGLDESLGLQMISIRLPKGLIDDLRYFAEREGLGYQPLMRRVLIRWVSHEYKMEAQERLSASMATADVAVEQMPCSSEDEQDRPDRMVAYA